VNAVNQDEMPIKMTKKELRETVLQQVKPLEEAAYAKGKRDGAAEANDSVREATMEKAACVLSAGKNAAGASSPTPVDLARRARELQNAALKEGREMGNIESVRLAYEEAGVPLR
jgi:hypothetical protein